MLLLLLCITLFSVHVRAATADQWRGRSIYQLLTDRYAVASSPPLNCSPGDQTWCGGSWNGIRNNLDYIQNAGFTAIWISPVNQNYEGPRTKYGDAYTGYWVTDVSKLNPRFGTSDDLKSLSTELHRRGMYLMVDVVLNNAMATSTTPNYSNYFFKDSSQYHPYCPIQWGNRTSEMYCWLGDTVVPLPDVNTENPSVSQGYQDWITGWIKEYSIDGLRIDGKSRILNDTLLSLIRPSAAKHAPASFWGPICQKGGVFCMGEVFGNDVAAAAEYQGPLDSVLNYPTYEALVQAFALPGPQNISGLAQIMGESRQKFKDVSVLGNFLENHDVPRWANISVDLQSLYNAMVFTFMTDGIPIVYYGQEQRLSGNADPWNREALWPSNYVNTSQYQMIATLNKLRNFLVNSDGSTWTTSQAQILTVSGLEIAILKGNVLSILTSSGSPPRNESVAVYTPWATSMPTIDILSCTPRVVGSNGTMSVEYSEGGHAVVVVPTTHLQGSGLCGYPVSNTSATTLHSSSKSMTRLSWAPLVGVAVALFWAW